MAARYWRGGTGTWDASTTTNWSASDGGSGGASVPIASDDVFFTALSGAGTCTVTGTMVCRSIDGSTSASSVTLTTANNTGKLVIGDASGGAFTFAAGKIANAYAGAVSTFQFVSTSNNGGTGWAITTNGNTMGPILFNGAGGKWVLQDTLNGTIGGNGDFVVNSGTLDTNNQTITGYWAFNSTGSTTRVITLGSSALTFSSTGIPWNTTSTGMTFTAGTSTITLSGVSTGASVGFVGSGLTYNDVSFTGVGLFQMSGTNTFHNVTITGRAATGETFVFLASQTMNALTISGSNVTTNRIAVTGELVAGLMGVARTITVATAPTLTNVDFQDITAAGAGGTWAGTSIGDLQGNSNITFTLASGTSNGGNGVKRYLVAGAASVNWSASNWSTSDGGATGASVPLPQDDVYITSNSFSGTRTLTLDISRTCRNLDMTGCPSTVTVTKGAGTAVFFHGNITLPALAGAGFATTGAQINIQGRGNQTLTSGGNLLAGGLIVNAPGGTYTIQDTTKIGGRTTHVQGTWSEGTANVTYQGSYLSTLAGATRTWVLSNGGTTTFGDPTIALGAATAVINIANVSTFTLTSTNNTLVFQRNSDNFAKQFTGIGLTWGNITVKPYVGLNFDFLGAVGTTTYGTVTLSPMNKYRLSGAGTQIYLATQWQMSNDQPNGSIISLNSPTKINFRQSSGTAVLKYMTISDVAFAGGARFLLKECAVSTSTGYELMRDDISTARTVATVRSVASVRSAATARTSATG